MRALWAKGQNRELYSLSKPAVFAGKSEPANDMIFVLVPLWHPERFPFTETQAGVRRYFDPPIYWPRGQNIVWYFDPGVNIS